METAVPGLYISRIQRTSVPRDLGPASIRPSNEFWPQLRTALSTSRFLTARHGVKYFMSGRSTDAIEGIYKKLQILICWALYTQKGHSTAKTFFQTIRQREARGHAMTSCSLTTPVSDGVSDTVLQSLFVSKSTSEITKVPLRPHPVSSMPPFVTPFGPSIL